MKKMKKTDKEIKKKITKNMNISNIIKKNPKAGEILIKEGMLCLGCPMAIQETLGQACKSHGIDVKKILKKLNK